MVQQPPAAVGLLLSSLQREPLTPDGEGALYRTEVVQHPETLCDEGSVP